MVRFANLVLLLVASSLSTLVAAKAPVMEPVVETVVQSHPGAVGGLAIDTLEYLYVADFQETLWRYDIQKDELKPFAKGFYGASGVLVDRDGSIYQANFFGHSIDKVSRTGEVTRFVTDGLNGPVGLTKNADGDLVVCNCSDQSIKKVNPAGEVSEFVRSSLFNCPNGITQDAAGNYYVVSFSGSKVVKITPEGEASEFADTQGKGLGHIAYVNGSFYATSYNDNRVYKISAEGEVSILAGTGERGQKDGAAINAKFSNPNGIAANAAGTAIFINDYIGESAATGMAISPYSIRRIDIPSLAVILSHAIDSGSIEDAKAAYNDFMATPYGEANLQTLNRLGWGYMAQGKFQEAVAVFEINADAHPDSWLVYSSLGGGYQAIGENEKAIAVLRKTLEMNPSNNVAKGRLQALGAPFNE